ncbi:MAG: peptide ABC transporter substrate-binding protein [Chloroflexaceae bacterium]
MARRIRWQIVIATLSALLVVILLGRMALLNAAVSSPLPGGSYVEAVIGAPTQPIPLLNDPLVDPAGRDLGALLFDGLTRIGSDGLPEAALAADWQIDSSGEVYTFNLRRDVTWHDGTPFTAADVVFTLQAIQSADFTGDPALANLWRNVLVDRLDDYTVRCTLNVPYAPFLSKANVPILPAHLLGNIPISEWSNAAFARQLIGTGPYQLEELTGERALLTLNSAYFVQQPLIDRIELRFIETTPAALSALDRGEVQALGMAAEPDLSQVALPQTIRRLTLPLDAYTVLTFNLRNAPLDSQALRQALSLGLDKNVLIEQVLGGTAVRVDTPILPGWWAYDATVQGYAYNPIAAEAALEDLGYTPAADGIRTRDGEPLVLSLITDGAPERQAAAADIARQWQDIGVQVEIEELDSPALRRRLRDRDFVMALHSWTRLGADPDVFELWHSSQAASGLNYAGLRDEEIDTLLISARTELELAARNADYAAFQQRWIDLAPSIILYQPLYNFTADTQIGGFGFDTLDQNRLSNAGILIGREDRYRNVTRWFVRSSREIPGSLRQGR